MWWTASAIISKALVSSGRAAWPASVSRTGAAGAAEQGGAGELFELADLLGNGPRGDVQFLGRPGEGQVAGSGLEGAQGVEGGEAVFLGHFT